ncbi:GNAT family N-acetyltransferase [Algicola sagamiensis]|uniref:GNAT family N-acetyltransferase n=1 Tax=Algicola sagamiensis TaxID=163869 RepID=UPI0003A9233E|nr:GNAT family N-acetyltransferase [Algicola sagamiensis]
MNIHTTESESFARYWQMLLSEAENIAYYIQPEAQRYYAAYFEINIQDARVVVELGGEPIIGLAMTQHQKNGITYFGYAGLGAQLIVHRNASDTARKGAYKALIHHLESRLNENTPIRFEFHESVQNSLSPLALWLMKHQAESLPYFQQTIHLNVPLSEIKTNIRKSYKGEIKKGETLLSHHMTDHDNFQKGCIQAMQQLHLDVAGKKTRSDESWDSQERQIAAGEAFLIEGYLEEELVSAGLYLCSPTICYYGVGVYQREHFDKPLSHIQVWLALQEAQKRGCRVFDFGESFFAGQKKADGAIPNEKELHIADFKRGFGGLFLPSLRLVFTR